MADWRLKLRPASFKGVNFQVESHDNESGRRAHIHEYPNKNSPYAEDMGRVSEAFVIEGFVIGDDYIEKRDALKAACNSYGAGTLIHPTQGTKQVICTGCRISERFTEGRIARFSLSFIDAGQQAFPSSIIDFKDQVAALASSVAACATANFLNRFSIKGLPTDVANSVAGVAGCFAQKALTTLELANSKVSTLKDAVKTGTNTIDTITNIASLMAETAADSLNVLKEPAVFASRTSSCIAVFNAILSPRDAIRQTKATTNLAVSEQIANINPKTPKGAKHIEMIQQISVLTQRIGLANQAKTISSIEFQNSAEAQKIMDDFIEQIEEQILLEVPSDDAALQALKELRAVLVKDIANTIKRLPEVRNIKLSEATTAVALAYDLYEDIGRAGEIVGRNHIKNPGFIPNGKQIEVLSQ